MKTASAWAASAVSRALVDAAAGRDQVGVVVGPARARQFEQSLALGITGCRIVGQHIEPGAVVGFEEGGGCHRFQIVCTDIIVAKQECDHAGRAGWGCGSIAGHLCCLGTEIGHDRTADSPVEGRVPVGIVLIIGIRTGLLEAFVDAADDVTAVKTGRPDGLMVWITDGVSGDRVVQSGQQTTLRSKSKICVQAFAPSVIRIQPPAPAASALIRNQNLNFEMGATQPPAEAL